MAVDDKKRNAEGHRGRLRKKFLEYGLSKFTDDEIVELLLTLGTPRRDCKQTARSLLSEFGSLAAVLDASVEQLQRVDGVGPTNAFGVRLIQAIARKFLREKIINRDYLNSFEEALDYFTHALRDEKQESFHALFLNAQNAILGEERLAVGAANQVIVTPRQVMERGLTMGATMLVLVHNHPGGTATPSPADRGLTREMVFAARLLDLRVREHLIVAGETHFSFWREGLIDKYDEEFDRFHQSLFSEQ